eukprot:s574_g27.t1
MRCLPAGTNLQPFVRVYKARNSSSMQLAIALLHVCVAFARRRLTKCRATQQQKQFMSHGVSSHDPWTLGGSWRHYPFVPIATWTLSGE